MKEDMTMKWNTLKYLFKEGIVGLWRNRTMAFASAGTIVLCLLILGMSYSVGTNIDYMIEQIESKFGITAYLEDGLSDTAILGLKNKIEAMPNVAGVSYISKDDALKNFSEENEDASLFAMFKEDNPLPASFEITAIDIKNQSELVKKVQELEGIDEAVYLKNETEAFINIRNTVNYVCYAIIICLIVVGLLLMSNTIKLTVYIRKREINIMKYVGATDGFIRVPFLIEGMLVGLIGALVAILAVASAYNWVQGMSQSATGILGEIALMPTATIMTSLIPMYLSLGIGIGLIGSAFAIHKHLKV